MNILPKKNWHVRKKENIARVRRDEAEAAALEKERLRKIQVAEKEARVKLMKEKSKVLFPNQSIKTEVKKEENNVNQLEQSGHVNFFKELEEGLVTFTGTNKDYEKEKKAESEKYEKQIGYLTYLGQDTVELTGNISWYNKVPERSGDVATSNRSESATNEVALEKKGLLDPLKDIRRYLGFTDSSKSSKAERKSLPINDRREDEKKKDGKRKRDDDNDDVNCSSLAAKRKKRKSSREQKEDRQLKRKYSMSKKKKKKKKHKKNKYKSESEGSSSNSNDEDVEELKKVKLEALRAQRLQREAEERLRAKRLLAKMSGETLPEDKKPAAEVVIKQKYHSQFNPHLAKQNFIEDTNV